MDRKKQIIDEIHALGDDVGKIKEYIRKNKNEILSILGVNGVIGLGLINPPVAVAVASLVALGIFEEADRQLISRGLKKLKEMF